MSLCHVAEAALSQNGEDVKEAEEHIACNTDCSLRQGAGGTEFVRLGSRTCCLR